MNQSKQDGYPNTNAKSIPHSVENMVNDSTKAVHS